MHYQMPKGRKTREITSSEWFNREMPCGKIYSGKRESHEIKNYEDCAVNGELLQDMNNGYYAQSGVAAEPRKIPYVIGN